jgi:hypothetical protein
MSNDTIQVLLYVSGTPARTLSANPSTAIGDLLQQAGVDLNLEVYGADDDADDGDADIECEPLARDTALRDLVKGCTATVHCHNCRQIQVTVNYQKESIRRGFLPSSRARKVLRWAKRKLGLTDADADNLSLFRCGGGSQIRETTHLGEIAAPGSCELCFDLTKDRNIEGSI